MSTKWDPVDNKSFTIDPYVKYIQSVMHLWTDGHPNAYWNHRLTGELPRMMALECNYMMIQYRQLLSILCKSQAYGMKAWKNKQVETQLMSTVQMI